MKFSFIASLAVAAGLFVVVAVLYGALYATGGLGSLQDLLQAHVLHRTHGTSGTWFTAPRVFGYAGLFGSLGVLFVTALATLTSAIYNWQFLKFGGAVITLEERVVLRPGQVAKLAGEDFTATGPWVREDGSVEVKLTPKAKRDYQHELQPGDTFPVRDQTWQLDRVVNADREDWKLEFIRVD
jgi:hypothetical protein